MARLNRSVASLRVAGEELRPDDVTDQLKINPTMSFARGDQIGSHRAPGRVAKSGLWTLDAPETTPGDVDAQVSALLGPLTTDLNVWRQLAERFEVDLFCGWFMANVNEGISIGPATLSTLAERHILLDLDIYSGDREPSGGDGRPLSSGPA